MRRYPFRLTALPVLIALVAASWTSPTHALDDEHWQKSNAAIQKGIDFLRSTQNEDGSWSPKPGPAITAMVVEVMLSQPGISAEDPHVKRGIAYILKQVNEDGSIHSGILDNYNTSICVSALVLVKGDPAIAKVVKDAERFLRGLQWAEGMTTPEGQVITKDHPFYGGVGYGNHGRPDGSNLQYMLQAMHDAGVDCEDPVFTRAMTYIHRLQGIESNDLAGDMIVQDGGFIYATAINKDLLNVPQSMANPELIEQAKENPGIQVTGLRTYGSMTYSMFKSMIYANLDRDDPRVVAAREWMSNNWTLDRNPGMPINEQTKTHLQGMYYYYTTMSRALHAWGTNTMEINDPDALAFVIKAPREAKTSDIMAELDKLKAKGIVNIGLAVDDSLDTIEVTERKGTRIVDWENELVAKLVSLQREDGSWINEADRWYEGDPNLVTAYALIALQHAAK